jgi:15-cis-phytoene synthase
VGMDLSISRYQTFEELQLYCYRVASVIGLLSMHIIGYDEGADLYAIQLGTALQLTNILRDVGEDATRGRIYLPLEDLERFGLCEDDILAGVQDRRFRALMRWQIERAERLYQASWPGITMLHDPAQDRRQQLRRVHQACLCFRSREGAAAAAHLAPARRASARRHNPPPAQAGGCPGHINEET